MARKRAGTLSDILFTQGFGTRYDCAALAASGQITIGGVVHDDPDETIDPEGLVFECRGETWPVRAKVLVALNKPAGYECSTKPSAHPSVMTLLPAPLRRRGVQPVGRLDVDTTGLLLFTDDGALQHRLIHPKRHVDKIYRARLKHPADETLIKRLLAGVVLDDDPVPVRAKAARLLSPVELELTLDEGKYHQVKRMVAAGGNRVEGLHRFRVGAYSLPEDLPEGRWVWIEPSDVLG